MHIFRQKKKINVCLYNIYMHYNNNKKKIYNMHIVKQSEVKAVARWPDGVC